MDFDSTPIFENLTTYVLTKNLQETEKLNGKSKI